MSIVISHKDNKVGQYLIFRDGRNYTANHLHEDREEARIEAERLCRKEEKRFLIAKIIGQVETEKIESPIKWEWEDENGESGNRDIGI